MKIYYLGIFRNSDDYGAKDGDALKGIQLTGEINFDTLGTGWTARMLIQNNKSNIIEVVTEVARLFASRAKPGEYPKQYQATLMDRPVVGYSRGLSEGIAAVIITDADYPARPAANLVSKIAYEFLEKYPRATIMAAPKPRDTKKPEQPCPLPQLKTYLTEYEDPAKADSMMKIQQDLDETLGVVHKTIEDVIHRGEKLDNLIEKSANLSDGSRAFYKSSKKANSSWCCIVM